MSAIMKPTSERETLAIFAATEDRELMDPAESPDFLPYDTEFEIEVEAVECKARKNYDNSGVFFTFIVRESNNPEIKVNKTYTVAWFNAHPRMQPFVIGKQLKNRREFAATLAGKDSDDVYFKDGPVLKKLHDSVEPLAFRVRIKNTLVRESRKGKSIYEYRYARVTH